MNDRGTSASSAGADAHAPPSRATANGPRGRSWVPWFALASAAVLLAVLGVVWRASNATPDWWQPASALSPDAPDRAGALERGATRAIYEPREQPETPWTVSITQHDANAWLTHRLHPWLESRGIAWAEDQQTPAAGPPVPRVRFEQGVVRLAVQAGGRVVGLASKPAVEHGAIVLRDTVLLLGTIELKGGMGTLAARRVWGRLLADLAPHERDSLVAALTGQGGAVVRDPVLDLDDGRSVRLIAIEVREGELRLTCATGRAETE